MKAEPSKGEVLGWMRRTGRTAAEAIDEFWPGSEGAERTRVGARIRKWGQLARAAGSPDAPPSQSAGISMTPNRDEPGGDPAIPARPAPDYETARLDRVTFLELFLAEAVADIAWVRGAGLVGRIAQLVALAMNIRQELDAARGEQGRVVQLERSPGAVAVEVEKRKKALEILAAAQARAVERERDL